MNTHNSTYHDSRKASREMISANSIFYDDKNDDELHDLPGMSDDDI